ncbi:MAG: bifunctional diaminohydroxyphosphoribosylaminopyrimidine deaminase/5-amino-6-(5-phosphoribosylamino)uracil reductase RibD [Gemmatimonadaceae bacterium]
MAFDSASDRVTDARDEQFMRRALSLAERGWGQTAPNPMVGAVIVRDGEVVGEGWHEKYGEAHAETNAIASAGPAASGATMYVTLEPCIHTGKTPPCSNAVIAAGLSRVVIAARDPGVKSGGGAQVLGDAGISVQVGVLETEARELNAPFFHFFASDRPWVTLKLALSIDGAIADSEHGRAWLSNELSRAEVHRIRANVDAIAVGATTYATDHPALSVRGPVQPRVAPTKVVFDPDGRLSAGRTSVLEEFNGVTFVRVADLAASLRALRARGIRSLLVEGGATLASALLDEELVDRLVIFQAPIVLGGGALAAFGATLPRRAANVRRLPVLRRQAFDDDLMTVYALHAV